MTGVQTCALPILSQVCERWIYRCVCFALDFDEQKRSGFRYQYSSYQIEYSRNLVFQLGEHLDQVFQALIDRSRAPLDLKSIRTILGYRRRPRYRPRAKRSAEWEVSVERPAYDLTIFKLHCGKLTLKIYSKSLPRRRPGANVSFVSRPLPIIRGNSTAAVRWMRSPRSCRD